MYYRGFFALFCGFVLVASIYDVVIHRKCSKNKKEIFSFENNNTDVKLQNTHADGIKYYLIRFIIAFE